ncbi:MAG: YfhO family protein [Chloroflexi bacterium]|nr:YfhO family protein [Chloroflexota bacterium]
MKNRLPDATLLALLLALPLLFHWRILAPGALDRGSFPSGDFAEQFYAFARFAYNELSHGRVPLWNPYTYAGHPFLADVQSAVFYPPSLLVMLAASALGGFSLLALEWQAVLHFSQAGIFTYLFARDALARMSDVGVTTRVRGAAFLAALVFTFGGYLTSYPSQQLAVLETDVWLPLVLLVLGRTYRARTVGSGAALAAGFVFGIALLAGHPQSALYVGLASAAYALFTARIERVSWRALLVSLGLFGVAALGVSAIQWLPSFEFMRLSSRQSLSYDDYARGFDLLDPLQMLLPGSVSAYSPLYAGIVPLALALMAPALSRHGRRLIAFWIGLAVVALALSFGGNLFFYPLLYLFAPLFALFRQQERAAFLFSFALAMLAGHGALALCAPLPRGLHRRLRAFSGWAFRAVVLTAAFFVLLYFAWMVAELKHDSPFREASERAVWLALMLGGLALLLAFRLRMRWRSARLLALAAVLVGLDLFTVNWQTNFQPLPPEAQVQPPAYLSLIQADASEFRTYNEYRLFGNFGDTFDLADTWGASPLRLAAYEQFHKLPLARVWGLLNVKYVITWRQSLAELGVMSEVIASQKISDKESTYVHRLANVAPRAALVGVVDVVPGQAEAMARLGAPEFDFARQAIVPAPVAVNAPDIRGGVTLLSRTANGSTWQVNASRSALLVLAENDYPGWRALVDGVDAPIACANVIMRAVVVPAGTHRVEFVFDPPVVKLGAAISLFTLAALGAVALWSRRRHAA